MVTLTSKLPIQNGKNASDTSGLPYWKFTQSLGISFPSKKFQLKKQGN